MAANLDRISLIFGLKTRENLCISDLSIQMASEWENLALLFFFPGLENI